MRYILYVILSVFLTACISPKVKENKKPYWLEENALLNTGLVVGYAPSTFQGMFMQRQNALHDAKKKLSFNIKSIITSKSIENIELYKENISIESIKNIDAFSKLALHDIKQFDAYVDENNNLYVLMGISSAYAKPEDKSNDLKFFDKKQLLESKCYKKDILEFISTSSYIYHDKPLWFYELNEKGFHFGIGIAEKIDENYESQKKVALMLAKADLSKQINSYSSSKMKMLEILKSDERGVLLESLSTHKSISKINTIKIKDVWMDPRSCELYILVYSNSSDNH
jgi:hypothetical protein